MSWETGIAVHPPVAFGDAAVPEVVRIVHPANKRYEAVGAGLEVFRLMIEHPTVLLSQQNREIIRGMATDIIQTDGLYFTVYTKVINLASVLHDPALDAQIRAIADDPNEMARRGVTEPDLIEHVRQVARDRVAGVRCYLVLNDLGWNRCVCRETDLVGPRYVAFYTF